MVHHRCMTSWNNEQIIARRKRLEALQKAEKEQQAKRHTEQLASVAAFGKTLEKLTTAQSEVAAAGLQAVAVFGSRKAAGEALGLTSAQLRELVPRPASAKKPAEAAE
jgi:polyphosphate kinase 2 (PPK2 family)